MNKRDLIDAISDRMGDKKTATEAVNAVLDTIQVTVAKGDKVAITGFGVFEKAVRPARPGARQSGGPLVATGTTGQYGPVSAGLGTCSGLWQSGGQ